MNKTFQELKAFVETGAGRDDIELMNDLNLIISQLNNTESKMLIDTGIEDFLDFMAVLRQSAYWNLPGKNSCRGTSKIIFDHFTVRQVKCPHKNLKLDSIYSALYKYWDVNKCNSITIKI